MRSGADDARLEASQVDVSVVMAVYNTADFVPEAMLSVLGQLDASVELIVIDDCSTDGSLEAVRSTADGDPRVRIVVQPENRGLSAARNLGLAKARGRFVLFLDSDDALDENAVRLLIDRADSADADVVYFDAMTILDMEDAPYTVEQYDAFYTRSQDYSEPRPGDLLLQTMLDNGDWRPSACMQLIRRDWLIGSGVLFPVGLIHEDNQFSGEVALRARRALHLPERLYCRRIRSGSTTTRVPGPEHIASLLAIARHFDETSEKSAGLEKMLRKRLRDRMHGDAEIARSRAMAAESTAASPTPPISRGWREALRDRLARLTSAR